MTTELPVVPAGMIYNEYGLLVSTNWKRCWWKRCWYLPTPDGSPYIVQLADDTLWVVPTGEYVNWGAAPRPDTSTFAGPFESFDEALATFTLTVTE